MCLISQSFLINHLGNRKPVGLVPFDKTIILEGKCNSIKLSSSSLWNYQHLNIKLWEHTLTQQRSFTIFCKKIYVLWYLLFTSGNTFQCCEHCLFRNAWYMCYSAIDVWGTPQPNIKTPKYWGFKKLFFFIDYYRNIIKNNQ